MHSQLEDPGPHSGNEAENAFLDRIQIRCATLGCQLRGRFMDAMSARKHGSLCETARLSVKLRSLCRAGLTIPARGQVSVGESVEFFFEAMQDSR